ncbi:MAG: endonuclease/exonuclease/phosphatase family protein [Bdellovibrionales bacterium]|nr:endonuclease/exonuclease/phosphatase family protein [Bdellovibrionales bacterium]NQZ18567.1 endonuclease/exonuclease/phosphatase family protein [Bdellovibrionales bacterium]
MKSQFLLIFGFFFLFVACSPSFEALDRGEGLSFQQPSDTLTNENVLNGEENFSRDQKTLTVMTYNMHGIPCLKRSIVSQIANLFGVERCPDNTVWSRNLDRRMSRFTQVLNELNSRNELPDFLVLQEMFISKQSVVDNSPIQNFLNSTPYPFQSSGPEATQENNVSGLVNSIFRENGAVSSGLVILSKFPIVQFSNLAFWICEDSDCMSNKGVAFASVQVEGLPDRVDIFNTHLQAGQRFENIKAQQVPMMVEYIQSQSSSPWVIAAGDFNFRNNPDFHSFEQFTRLSQMDFVGEACRELLENCQKAAGTLDEWLNGSLLDHQFVTTNSNAVTIDPIEFEYGQYDFEGGDLTDHPYHLVKYLLTW